MVNASFNLLLLPIPASPSTFEHERADVITRSINNHRTILSIPLSAPLMPPLPLMPDLATPTTPATTTVRRSSTSSIVFSRRRPNNNKKTERSNEELPVIPMLPTKKMQIKKAKSKHVLHQIKRVLLLGFTSSKNQQAEEGCCSSRRTSTTVSTSTSTSSLLMATQRPQSEEMITTPMLLTPRVRMFHEEEQEEAEEQEQVTMIKPAAPWSTQQVVAVVPTTITQPTPSLLSASLNKALSVLSVSSNDHDDDDGDNDEDDDDWGIFVSIDDTDDDEEHDRKDSNNYDWYSPLDNRSYLPVSFAESLWNQ